MLMVWTPWRLRPFGLQSAYRRQLNISTAAWEKSEVRTAVDNPGWGFAGIQSALRNVGHEVGRVITAEVLKREGIEPASLRGKCPGGPSS
jgi:hypothetical protein